eukprot:2515902-Rhodomonas_salina.1
MVHSPARDFGWSATRTKAPDPSLGPMPHGMNAPLTPAVNLTESPPIIATGGQFSGHIDATAAQSESPMGEFRAVRRPAPRRHGLDIPAVAARTLSMDGSWMVRKASRPSP